MKFRKIFSKQQTDVIDSTEINVLDELEEQARRLALKKLFGQTRFNQCDNLNEYAEGYDTFSARGSIVPIEMQQALRRLETLTGNKETLKTEQTEQTEVSEPIEQTDHDSTV